VIYLSKDEIVVKTPNKTALIGIHWMKCGFFSYISTDDEGGVMDDLKQCFNGFLFKPWTTNPKQFPPKIPSELLLILQAILETLKISSLSEKQDWEERGLYKCLLMPKVRIVKVSNMVGEVSIGRVEKITLEMPQLQLQLPNEAIQNNDNVSTEEKTETVIPVENNHVDASTYIPPATVPDIL